MIWRNNIRPALELLEKWEPLDSIQRDLGDADDEKAIFFVVSAKECGGWAVLTGKAHAIHWPVPGELEEALDQ